MLKEIVRKLKEKNSVKKMNFFFFLKADWALFLPSNRLMCLLKFKHASILFVMWGFRNQIDYRLKRTGIKLTGLQPKYRDQINCNPKMT